MATVSHGTAQSPVRRFFSGAGRVALTVAFFAAAVAVGTLGYGVLSARSAATVGPDPAPSTTVAADRLEIVDELVVTRRFTGQFEPMQEVALGFEEGGTIAEVLVREGLGVSQGEVIARLDTRLLEADRARLSASRAALAAQVELARRTDARQQTLLAEGHVTQQRVDETSLLLAQLEAALAEADAGIAAVDVRLSKAVLRAPFDGRVGARLLDDGAVAGPGAAVVTLLENGLPRFRVAIDPDLAAETRPGTEVRILADGRTFDAVLSELAPELDAATRGRLAYFDLVPGAEPPPARSTGEVQLLDRQARRGAWVPVSALWQGPRGTWTILTVEDAGERAATIATEAVEVLRLDGERAFVRGSFADGARYLADGTHRVVPGETVLLAGAE